MRSITLLVLAVFFISACNKKTNDIAWERTYGKGKAVFISVAPDSGLVACGTIGGKPYLIRLDKNKKIITEIEAESSGIFTSVVYDTSGYITAGSSGGKMLIMRYSRSGRLLWEKTINPGFNIDHTQLLIIGDDNYLAVGSADPDTIYNSQTGLVLTSVDSTGLVLKEQNYLNGFFVAANEAVNDSKGNIYLALTRRESNSEPMATVAKFNSSFQRIWETELVNNPAFGAATLTILSDNEGTYFAGGRTQLPKDGGGTINNSFVAAINEAGTLIWKKYPEISNSASALLLEPAGDLVVLNHNCFFINRLDRSTGTDGGRIRMFEECDPNTTDAFASDSDFDIYGDLVIAGSLNGSFYLAVKSL